MSKSLPVRPRVMLGASPSHFAIVASKYNMEFVQGLVDATTKELYHTYPTAHIDLVQVPGAFEIPLAAKLVARQRKYDAIIALGVIIRGDTDHADLIGRTVTDSLQQISLETEIPVIHEVLLVENREQAAERCQGEELNRGTEAARVAIEVAHVILELKKPS